MSGRSYKLFPPTFSACVDQGAEVEFGRAVAKQGCREMLRLMPCAGQHYHATAAARNYATALGMSRVDVKPGIGA